MVLDQLTIITNSWYSNVLKQSLGGVLLKSCGDISQSSQETTVLEAPAACLIISAQCSISIPPENVRKQNTF